MGFGKARDWNRTGLAILIMIQLANINHVGLAQMPPDQPSAVNG